MSLQIEKTSLPGVLQLTPQRFRDDRGWFSEVWNVDCMAKAGLEIAFVQDNHSFSAAAGTLRGLHFQTPPKAQDKLVRCTRGAILDVAVDIRHGSPFYGRWISVVLSAENHHQLFIPKGFLHGFLTLQDNCEVQYKCSDFYDAECDRAVCWNDPVIGVEWGLGAKQPTLSKKDLVAPSLGVLPTLFVYGEKC